MSEEARMLNSILYNTLHKVFKHVLVIPGEENYYVASDSNLTYNISSRLRNLEIQTKYVNENYLQAKISPDRISGFFNSLVPTPYNQDLGPKACFYSLLLWMKQFGSWWLIGVIILVPLGFVIIKKPKPVETAILTTGFLASGLEVIILFLFQIFYGYVYHAVGLLLTAFMLGIVIGSWYARGSEEKRLFLILEFFLFSLPLVILAIAVYFPWFYLFPVLAVSLGLLTGMQFPLASVLDFSSAEETGGRLFAYDLIGGSLGAFLIGMIFVPLFGIIYTCLMMAGLKIISLTFVYRSFSSKTTAR